MNIYFELAIGRVSYVSTPKMTLNSDLSTVFDFYDLGLEIRGLSLEETFSDVIEINSKVKLITVGKHQMAHCICF